MKIDFEKGGGLVPAIIQDSISAQVLMLGYMSPESLAKTHETGLVTFYSRSRKTLWTKGETSGNTLAIVSISADCDSDTLLIQATPKGPTCHTGDVSCFGDTGFSLSILNQLIESRKTTNKTESYTSKLLRNPITKSAQKVGEEGVEVALAAVAENNESLLGESADLIYHLMVVLAKRGLSIADVIDVLGSRHKPD